MSLKLTVCCSTNPLKSHHCLQHGCWLIKCIYFFSAPSKKGVIRGNKTDLTIQCQSTGLSGPSNVDPTTLFKRRPSLLRKKDKKIMFKHGTSCQIYISLNSRFRLTVSPRKLLSFYTVFEK